MGNIYARAVITIIAAAGEDASYGLPGMGSVPRKGQAEETFNGVSFIEGNPRPHESLKASKWGKRGWTLQEGYLSPRRLIFTDYEVHFLCNEMLFSESWKYDLPPKDRLLHNNRHFEGIIPLPYEPKSAACHLVEECSQRAFSYDSDALNGFTGIMKALEMPGELTFLWGVPIIHLTGLYLDWSHDVPSARRREFPSWSPLGWKGPLKAWRHSLVWHSSGIRAGNDYEIEFHNLEAIPNPISLGTDAPRYLYWTEKVVNARVITRHSGRAMVDAWLSSGKYKRLDVEVYMDGFSNGGDHFLLIPTMKSESRDDFCWLLEHQGAFWERIGVVRARSRSKVDGLSGWEEINGSLDWKVATHHSDPPRLGPPTNYRHSP